MNKAVQIFAFAILLSVLVSIVTYAFIYEQQISNTQQTILNVPYFYVDNNISEIDLTEDIGTHSNFAAQKQIPNSTYDILTESENSGVSLDATGGYMVVGDGSPDWGSVAGTISFWVKMDSVVQGRFWGQGGDMEIRWSGSNLVLDWGGTSSMTSATSFSADVWYFVAIVWDENIYNLNLYIGDINNSPILDANSLNATWTNTLPPVTENRFLNGLGGNEPVDGHGDDLRYYNIARDLVDIQSDYNITLSGSEINLRSYFRLNNNFDDIGPDNNDGSDFASYSFSNDTPFNTQPMESLKVDVWTGSDWQNLFANLSNGWNNATISSYLTSSTLTIRFKGNGETSDSTQDSWNIDSTVIHAWT